MLSKLFTLSTFVFTLMATLTFTVMESSKKTMMIEWTMMSILSTKMSMMIMIDVKSTAFSSCVFLITTAIIMYSKYYMSHSTKKVEFNKLVMVFITSMIMLIHSPNMISMIVGWEGLGMTSFVLIMFYSNTKSMNSSFYTMMMNRLGDISMLLAMTMMMNTSSWMFTSTLFKQDQMMMTMIMMAAFSKSAQIPFSSWLTEAMAAPTPISALVHSSTLVTAGVLILIRFEMLLKYNKINMLILTVSMMTLVMASMNSLTEWDVKKIVALSTLSQLSMMFMMISLNMYKLAMFHMLVHATFKALIFVCSSTFITMSNSQDLRKINSSAKSMFMTKMMFNVATMTLCGFPFLSSFFSKEVIMEMVIMTKNNWMMVLMFYACMTCTLTYSLKMMVFINSNKSLNKMMPEKESTEQKVSTVMLITPSVIYGNKMNWIMNTEFMFPHMKMEVKLVPLVMMIVTTIIMTNMKNSFIKKKSYSTMMVNYMWFMKNMGHSMESMFIINSFSTMKTTEKSTFTTIIKMNIKLVESLSAKGFIMISKNKSMVYLMMLTAAMMML